MGKLFRYIIDQVAAQAETGICHYCDQARTVYPIRAVADDADYWDKGTEQIDELCAHCIRVIPLISLATRESERWLTAHINSHYPKGTLSKELRQTKLIGLADRLRRTPEMPLFLQGDDWPFCCGEWCEFLGVPDNGQAAIALVDTDTYWSGGPGTYASEFGDMTLEPEDLEEVSLFRCLHCHQPFFTWQFT